MATAPPHRDARLRYRHVLARLLCVFARERSVDETRERVFFGRVLRETHARNEAGNVVEIWRFLDGHERLRLERRDGRLHGVWLEHYASGITALRCHLHDGVPHGRTERWYPRGAKRWTGEYVHGEMRGEWFHFHDDGTLDRERTGFYAGGLRISGIKGFNEWLGSP